MIHLMHRARSLSAKSLFAKARFQTNIVRCFSSEKDREVLTGEVIEDGKEGTNSSHRKRSKEASSTNAWEDNSDNRTSSNQVPPNFPFGDISSYLDSAVRMTNKMMQDYEERRKREGPNSSQSSNPFQDAMNAFTKFLQEDMEQGKNKATYQKEEEEEERNEKGNVAVEEKEAGEEEDDDKKFKIEDVIIITPKTSEKKIEGEEDGKDMNSSSMSNEEKEKDDDDDDDDDTTTKKKSGSRNRSKPRSRPMNDATPEFPFTIHHFGNSGSQNGDGNSIFDFLQNLGGGNQAKEKVEIIHNTGVHFDDVAGLREAKFEIMEFIDFLKNQSKYIEMGARIPKGAILSGPPGTGKTLLAKAVAGEAGVPFLYTSGSDFVELYAGAGARHVRKLFKQARENAPCIVFIDEIDAVGKRRGGGGFSNADSEREQTLNQLLVEIDGFKSTDNIVVLASTNRAEILDKALLRSGRFDRHIAVELPDFQSRKEIAEIYLKRIKLSREYQREVIASKVASLTPGMSGADISNITNEAAILAVRSQATEVTMQHLLAASDRVLCGLKREHRVLSEKDRKRIAYHEAGHALVHWLSPHADPCLKVTIIPRTSGALGHTQHMPKEVSLYSVVELKEKMRGIMAGRAAEAVCMGDITTGSSDDLKKASQIATSMVMEYGFSEMVGPMCCVDESEMNARYNGGSLMSESLSTAIEKEKKRLLEDALNEATEMIRANKEKMDRLVNMLLERETITSVDLEAVLGKREGVNPDEYTEMMKELN